MVLGIFFCGNDGGLVSCGALSCVSLRRRSVESLVKCCVMEYDVLFYVVW